MKTKYLQLTALALLPAVFLVLSACSTPSTSTEQSSAVHTSDTSTTFVDTFHVTATVTAIDSATRKVTLSLANGNHIIAKCGPAVANFSQIHLNDVVKVTLTEELSAYLDKGRAMGASRTASGEVAALGAKPSGVRTDTAEETVKITALDTTTRKVTFRSRDGTSHTVKVAQHIDLAKAKVGDSVTFSHSQAIAVSVEKP